MHNEKKQSQDLTLREKCNILGKEDPLINLLEKNIRLAVKCLAILMTFVIIWGIFDVVWVLYQRILEPPFMLLNIHDILATFSAFMAVLIAIEIFANITMYLREDVLHVRMVVATALMAAARKIIVLDLEYTNAQDIAAIGLVVLCLGVTYWFLGKKEESK
ncbi:phosphate-starvation-inducible PsiE family protein [Halodesulfovibrio sp.]|uniref:phosphate-starvation-inducible PsiE family protein n=1 Tax=Halodesulfovibrio sp. TaxID=1912772 RepID=UPI0025C0EAE3|nr:phosphate-starvation-inducible PsiE family protein [Halodesulfovibrio sp.]